MRELRYVLFPLFTAVMKIIEDNSQLKYLEILVGVKHMVCTLRNKQSSSYTLKKITKKNIVRKTLIGHAVLFQKKVKEMDFVVICNLRVCNRAASSPSINFIYLSYF